MTREEANKALGVFTSYPACESNSKEYAKIVNEVISAISKSVPEDTTVITRGGNCKVICPACENVMHDDRSIYYKYCPYCGQRIEIKEQS